MCALHNCPKWAQMFVDDFAVIKNMNLDQNKSWYKSKSLLLNLFKIKSDQSVAMQLLALVVLGVC